MTNIPPATLPNSYWVLPGKLLAGEHPATADTEFTRARLRSLLSCGIRTFIDLTDEADAGMFGSTSYRVLLHSLAQTDQAQITLVNFPVADGAAPSPWTMRCILDVIDRSVADDNPVYLHCIAGRGRTGTVVGCYLQRHGLAGPEGVVRAIAALRRGTRSAGANSPQTPEQVRMVTTWAKGC